MVGKGVRVMAERLLLEAVLGMLPNPLQRSTGDHVAAPDVLVAPALRQFGQCPIVDRVGDAVADEVDPQRLLPRGNLGKAAEWHEHQYDTNKGTDQSLTHRPLLD